MEKAILAIGEVFKYHDTGIGHPESPKRIEVIVDFLKGFKHSGLEVIGPEKADREVVELVHSPEYVEYIKVFSESGGGHPLGDLDTVVSKRTYEVALYAVGTTLKILRKVIFGEYKVGFAAVRPPGHHAHRELAKGFCIFNNIAIAAKYLLENYGYRKIAILDIDAHHGDGTQEIFYTTDKVLYVSLHQDPKTLYPGTGFPEEVGEKEGEGFTVNIPLPPATGDKGYALALNSIALPIIELYEPEVLLVSAGFDTHHEDPLTDLNLTLKTYWRIGKALCTLLRKVEGVVAVLEGGYALNYLPKAILNLILACSSEKPLFDEKILLRENLGHARKYIERCLKIHKKYWEL